MEKDLLPGVRKKLANTKGTPPSLEETTSNNLATATPNEIVQLHAKIEKGKKKEMDQYALDHDISLTKVIIDSFDFYKKNNP